MSTEPLEAGLLDDNREFVEIGLIALEQAGVSVVKHTSAESFVRWVLETAATGCVLFVDHDLGEDRDGYDVVRGLRHARADGLIMPIVYLTGRETERGFIEREAEDPYSVPSMYLNKRDLIRVDMLDLVRRLHSQYLQARALMEAQSTQQAMEFFRDLPSSHVYER